MLENIKKICIYGMGMMGTSLAYSLKQHPSFQGEIIGVVRSGRSKEWILQNKLADAVYQSNGEDISFLEGCDFLVIGLPVLDTLRFLEHLSSMAFRGIVTDMGSTKLEIEKKVRTLDFPLQFAGSHPMCGSEFSGPEGYVRDLFLGKLCLVTTKVSSGEEDSNVAVTRAVQSFWENLGMHVFFLDAETHDYVLGYLSHMPHIVSSILAMAIGKNHYILENNSRAPVPILGGGLRDMLRIAGSNPKMWFDILSTNKEAILEALRNFQKELEEVLKWFENSRLEDWWMEWQNTAKKKRDEIYRIPD